MVKVSFFIFSSPTMCDIEFVVHLSQAKENKTYVNVLPTKHLYARCPFKPQSHFLQIPNWTFTKRTYRHLERCNKLYKLHNIGKSYHPIYFICPKGHKVKPNLLRFHTKWCANVDT